MAIGAILVMNINNIDMKILVKPAVLFFFESQCEKWQKTVQIPRV